MNLIGQTVAVAPRSGFEATTKENPFIAYNCLKICGQFAIVGNGDHVDPIAKHLLDGFRASVAIELVLREMGYENDSLQTPRIVAVADKETGVGLFGIVRKDALIVQPAPLRSGELRYLATYEKNYPNEEFLDADFDADSAATACKYILKAGVFASFEHAVCSASAIETESGFSVAHQSLH